MKIFKKLVALAASIMVTASMAGCSGNITELRPMVMAQSVKTNISVNHNLRVDYIDVGQGDAELLTSDGHSMLIDTGTPESGTAIRLYLKKQGISKLDYLVLTHPDADHIGGAASVITNVPIDKVLMPDCKKDNKTYNGVIDALEYKYLKAVNPVAGDSFELGSCTVKVLGPVREYDDPNNNSIVLKVTCGENNFMFIGDAEVDSLTDITARYKNELKSDVYKVGHHGSYNSSISAFIDNVSPKYSVISCGEGNSYGHPHAETLIRLREAGSHIFRTDVQGNIRITSDGENLSFDPSPCDDWTPGENTMNFQTTERMQVATNTNLKTDSLNHVYVLNTKSKKFHTSSCDSVNKMSDKNKEISNNSREDIVKAGYKPCQNCNP